MTNHKRKAWIGSCSALAFALAISNRRTISDADKPAVPEPILSSNPPESNTCHAAPSSVRYDRQTGYPSAVPLIQGAVTASRPEQISDILRLVNVCFSLQSQKAVSAYLKSKQILPFGFAQQCWCWSPYIHDAHRIHSLSWPGQRLLESVHSM